MNRFFVSRLTCARPSSRRNRSMARFTAALPLNVSFVGFLAAARIAATSARSRAMSRAARESVQPRAVLRVALWGEPEPHATRPSTSGMRRIEARAIANHSSLPRMLEKLTVDDFRPLLNEPFRIAPDAAEAFEVELVEETGPDAVAAVLRQQRDVHDSDLGWASVDVEPPRRLVVHQDHVEARLRVVLTPPGVLRVELLAQERLLLRVVPRHDRELLRPRACVDAVEELAVARLDRAKLDGLAQGRAGKTPWRARQKLSVR